MPKIQWERLPREKRSHVRERAKGRQISEQNLFELAEWKMQDPDVPDATGARNIQVVWHWQVSWHLFASRAGREGQAVVTAASWFATSRESQEDRKRDFFRRLKENLANDPGQQDRLVGEFRTLILGR